MTEHPVLPIAIYYEHPRWFKPLFAELDRRGIDYVELDAIGHTYAPDDHPEDRYALVLNRMSPSAWNRGHGDAIFYTLGYLEHLERRGVRVINGRKAFATELSKAAQLSLLQELNLPYPRSRVIHRAAQAIEATAGMRWPIVVKPNIGGSGAGVKRFDSIDSLRAAAQQTDGLHVGLDSTALVQEFIPARDSSIVRVEVLNGRFLYAIKVHITGETFDLCPADICRTPAGVKLDRFLDRFPGAAEGASAPEMAVCPADAPKAGLSVEGYQPSRQVIEEVERIMQNAGIEVGGVEYITDDRDGRRLYYDINALSNFVADGPRVVGFDPFSRLADWLEIEAVKPRYPGSKEKAHQSPAVSR